MSMYVPFDISAEGLTKGNGNENKAAALPPQRNIALIMRNTGL